MGGARWEVGVVWEYRCTGEGIFCGVMSEECWCEGVMLGIRSLQCAFVCVCVCVHTCVCVHMRACVRVCVCDVMVTLTHIITALHFSSCHIHWLQLVWMKQRTQHCPVPVWVCL